MENSKINYSEEKPKNVVKYDLEKIYSKILGKDYISYKFNKIVLGTKRLISNNLNYNGFSKEYDDITKIVSFKYPNLDNFPISKNLELIPLGKVRFSYDSTKNRIKSGNLPNINDKSKNNNHNLFLKSSIKNNNKTINKIKINSVDDKESRKDKDENEFGSKSLSKIMGYRQLKNNNGNTLSIVNNNSSIKYSSNYTSKKSRFSSFKNNLFNTNLKRRILIRNSFLNMLNYKKYLHNNRMLLRDSLLNEKDYFQLDYDEEKIFSQTEHYNNFIKNHINLIKSNSLNFECNGKLEKTFEKTKINPKLVLKPITIQFTRIFCFNNKAHPNSKDEEEVQDQTFEIPFEYTPIFYLYNFSKIKEILASIFQLNKDYTSFTSNYKNFSYLINHSSNYEDSSNFKQEEFQRNNSKKLLTSKTINFQSLSLNKAYSGKINKRNSMSLQKEVIKTIDIFNNDSSLDSFNNKRDLNQKYKSKSVANNLNSKNNKIYFCNKNSFEFLWLTPVYEYLVNIKVPEISFYIGDITINKNIDIELLLFLLENQFNNWDFYIIEYLFSFYKFSLIINNYLSIYKVGKFNLGNNFMLLNDVINLSEEKKLKYSRKNYNFEYIFTDEKLNNHIKILHNFKILIYNKNINKNHQFCFHMNLIQMEALYFSIKKQGAQHLIKKIFTLDKDTMRIKINYDYLDNFCSSDFHNLENILEKDDHEAFLETKENKYNFALNDNKICLVYPNLESIKFKNSIPSNRKEDCFESNNNNEIKNRLDFNTLEKILKTKNLFIWPNIIEFNKDNKSGNRNSKNILENSLSLNKKFITMKSVIIKKRNAFE